MDSTLLILFAAIVIVGVALLAMISMLGKRGSKLLNQQKYRETWLSIEQSIHGDEAVMQLAIIRADKLLDQALKERGFKGETMGERLKSARTSFRDINSVWNAHKLRNRIAHDEHVSLTAAQARKALGIFKSALKDMGAL